MTSKLSARASIPAAVVAVFLGSIGTGFANEPAVVKAYPPEYPRAAERREIEGEVIVSVNVDESGSVTAVNVVAADPAGVFDSAATDAVQRWKFESGKPFQGLKKKIVFKLEG